MPADPPIELPPVAPGTGSPKVPEKEQPTISDTVLPDIADIFSDFSAPADSKGLDDEVTKQHRHAQYVADKTKHDAALLYGRDVRYDESLNFYSGTTFKAAVQHTFKLSQAYSYPGAKYTLIAHLIKASVLKRLESMVGNNVDKILDLIADELPRHAFEQKLIAAVKRGDHPSPELTFVQLATLIEQKLLKNLGGNATAVQLCQDLVEVRFPDKVKYNETWVDISLFEDHRTPDNLLKALESLSKFSRSQDRQLTVAAPSSTKHRPTQHAPATAPSSSSTTTTTTVAAVTAKPAAPSTTKSAAKPAKERRPLFKELPEDEKKQRGLENAAHDPYVRELMEMCCSGSITSAEVAAAAATAAAAGQQSFRQA
ncbi:hypothetical protein GQ42DRAFT_165850 [Ramicandelaber brevisporus]|nr:hypothetical protein GQ42DRAFT_165850 [Ramicandelaber brevisporus]